MTRDPHSVVAGLSAVDRAGVEHLLGLCNQVEGLDLPIFLESEPMSGERATDFVVRTGEEPVGFAWLPDDPVPEACLMVHPDQRRRGIGRALLSAVTAEGRRRGLPGFLLVCDQASLSGRAFLASVGARYRSSEYRMVLDQTAIDRSRPRHPSLQMQPAGMDDLAVLSRLQAAAFGSLEDEGRDDLTRRLREPNRRHFLATLDGEPIGMISVVQGWSGVDVTSFGVLPAHRGQGFGRQMLLDTVDLLIGEGWEGIQIEVATENERALGLYQSCGFAIATAYGFYEIAT